MSFEADDAGGLTPGNEGNEAGRKLYRKALSNFDRRLVLALR